MSLAVVDVPFLAILWAGLASGLVHVVTGLDHMAALMPLSMGRRWRAAFLGVRWGLGHTMGVVFIALMAVEIKQLAGEVLNLDALGEWAERLVGFMLIAIGAFGIRAAFRMHLHAHSHSHDGSEHEHLHVHASDGHPVHAPAGHAHSHTAFLAGVLHGLAGTAHVLAVLPAVGLNTRAQSWSYLAAFGVGTVMAMGAFAGVIGMTSASLGKRGPKLMRAMMIGASCVCILVGIGWILLPTLGYELP